MKNYRYAVCSGSRAAYHASTIKELVNLAKSHYAYSKVYLYTATREIELYVRPEGFYNYDCKRISIKYISQFLNAAED